MRYGREMHLIDWRRRNGKGFNGRIYNTTRDDGRRRDGRGYFADRRSWFFAEPGVCRVLAKTSLQQIDALVDTYEAFLELAVDELQALNCLKHLRLESGWCVFGSDGETSSPMIDGHGCGGARRSRRFRQLGFGELRFRALDIDTREQRSQMVDLRSQPVVVLVGQLAGNACDDDGECLVIVQFSTFAAAEPANESPEIHAEAAVVVESIEESGEMVVGSGRDTVHLADGSEFSDVEIEPFGFLHTARRGQYVFLFEGNQGICGEWAMARGVLLPVRMTGTSFFLIERNGGLHLIIKSAVPDERTKIPARNSQISLICRGLATHAI